MLPPPESSSPVVPDAEPFPGLKESVNQHGEKVAGRRTCPTPGQCWFEGGGVRLIAEKDAMAKELVLLEVGLEQQREELGRIQEELAVKDPGLNSALKEKEQALAKWREVEPSIRGARDDEMKARQLGDNLLSKVNEVKAVSQREKD